MADFKEGTKRIFLFIWAVWSLFIVVVLTLDKGLVTIGVAFKLIKGFLVFGFQHGIWNYKMLVPAYTILSHYLWNFSLFIIIIPGIIYFVTIYIWKGFFK